MCGLGRFLSFLLYYRWRTFLLNSSNSGLRHSTLWERLCHHPAVLKHLSFNCFKVADLTGQLAYTRWGLLHLFLSPLCNLFLWGYRLLRRRLNEEVINIIVVDNISNGWLRLLSCLRILRLLLLLLLKLILKHSMLVKGFPHHFCRRHHLLSHWSWLLILSENSRYLLM